MCGRAIDLSPSREESGGIAASGALLAHMSIPLTLLRSGAHGSLTDHHLAFESEAGQLSDQLVSCIVRL